jgi:hypothetical protein
MMTSKSVMEEHNKFLAIKIHTNAYVKSIKAIERLKVLKLVNKLNTKLSNGLAVEVEASFLTKTKELSDPEVKMILNMKLLKRTTIIQENTKMN